MNQYDFQYHPYVQTCLRFYSSYRDPHFHSEAEKKNWCACRDVLSDFNDLERQTIIDVYSAPKWEFHDAVSRAAKEWKVPERKIWSFLNEVERRVGRKRGLI